MSLTPPFYLPLVIIILTQMPKSQPHCRMCYADGNVMPPADPGGLQIAGYKCTVSQESLQGP